MEQLNDIKQQIGVCRGNLAEVEVCARKLSEPNDEMQVLADNFLQSCNEFVNVYGVDVREAAKEAATFTKKYSKALLKPRSSKNHPICLLELFQSVANRYLAVFERLKDNVAAPIEAAARRQARAHRQVTRLLRNGRGPQ